MTFVRMLAKTAATLSIGFAALFLLAGTASADCDWHKPVPCSIAN